MLKKLKQLFTGPEKQLVNNEAAEVPPVKSSEVDVAKEKLHNFILEKMQDIDEWSHDKNNHSLYYNSVVYQSSDIGLVLTRIRTFLHGPLDEQDGWILNGRVGPYEMIEFKDFPFDNPIVSNLFNSVDRRERDRWLADAKSHADMQEQRNNSAILNALKFIENDKDES